jgi:hypothetical protein
VSMKYAIAEWVPSLSDDDNWNNSQRVFHPATKDVAASHEDGVFALFNNRDERITIWMEINGHQALLVSQALENVKHHPVTHKDALGEELAAGDYVTVSPNPSEVSIAKVLGSTKNQVRLVVFGRSYGITTKNPSGLVKIQPNILSD